jgi:hypothetical protein
VIPFSNAEVREKRCCKGHNFQLPHAQMHIHPYFPHLLLDLSETGHKTRAYTIMLLIIRGLRENRLRVAL